MAWALGLRLGRKGTAAVLQEYQVALNRMPSVHVSAAATWRKYKHIRYIYSRKTN